MTPDRSIMTAPAIEYSAVPIAALTATTQNVSGSRSMDTHVDAHDVPGFGPLIE
jgi:hypothetical protein